jgi:hypothetical protein
MTTKKIMKNAMHLRCLFLLLAPTISHSDVSSRKIRIINDSGSSVKIYWIDHDNNNEHHLVDATDLAPHGSQLSLSSFTGHLFEAHESPDMNTGVCATGSGNQSCRFASFTVKDDVVDEQSK